MLLIAVKCKYTPYCISFALMLTLVHLIDYHGNIYYLYYYTV